jgi:hypothetical protein
MVLLPGLWLSLSLSLLSFPFLSELDWQRNVASKNYASQMLTKKSA